jgi:two-component system cell cycle response regulator CtrA
MRVEIKDDDPRHILSIDLDAGEVCIDGVAVHLSPREYLLLDMLGWCAGTIVSSEFIAMCLYGTLEPSAFVSIKSAACRLRKTLSFVSGGRNYVFGFKNAGYMLA